MLFKSCRILLLCPAVKNGIQGQAGPGRDLLSGNCRFVDICTCEFPFEVLVVVEWCVVSLGDSAVRGRRRSVVGELASSLWPSSTNISQYSHHNPIWNSIHIELFLILTMSLQAHRVAASRRERIPLRRQWRFKWGMIGEQLLLPVSLTALKSPADRGAEGILEVLTVVSISVICFWVRDFYWPKRRTVGYRKLERDHRGSLYF